MAARKSWQECRNWLRRRKSQCQRFWRQKLTQPVTVFRRWWILWGALGLAAVFYVVGSQLVPVGRLSDFHSNLVAEAIGVLLSLAIAWLLIERHFQNQAHRVSASVNERIRAVRNEAARQVTSITTAAFNIPAFDSNDRGHWYIEHNYSRLRDLLGFKGPKPKWYRGGNRDPGQVAIMSQDMGALTRTIDQTIRLFSAGLLEYPTLLRTFERFEFQYTVDQDCWSQFWETYNSRQRERNRLIQSQGFSFDSTQPEIPLTPPEAYFNLITLADSALDIVVAATLILKDWNSMPGEQDAYSMRAIHSWRYFRNDHDPFGVFKAEEAHSSPPE